MQFTNEQLVKAKAAKSVEELLALARENGMELTEEEAKKYYAAWHKEGEFSDAELANVAGGCGGPKVTDEHIYIFKCPFCGAECKITITYYDNQESAQDKDHCSCGAEIGVYPNAGTAGMAQYYKNGQREYVNPIAHS